MDQNRVEKTKKLISQYKKTFSSVEGRAVLHDLMRGNFVLDKTTFVPGDPYGTARNEGHREVVVKILSILKMDPEQFFKLVAEQEGSHV